MAGARGGGGGMMRRAAVRGWGRRRRTGGHRWAVARGWGERRTVRRRVSVRLALGGGGGRRPVRRQRLADRAAGPWRGRAWLAAVRPEPVVSHAAGTLRAGGGSGLPGAGSTSRLAEEGRGSPSLRLGWRGLLQCEPRARRRSHGGRRPAVTDSSRQSRLAATVRMTDA